MWWLLLLLIPLVLILGRMLGVWLLYTPRPEAPDFGKRRIACIGDSITFGSGVMQTRQQDAWVFILGRLLGEDCQVINFGVSGAALQDQGDKPYRRQGMMEKVREARPDVIVLMLGTNDSKPQNWEEDRFRREYAGLVDELRACPWPHKLVLMTPPRAFPQEKTGEIPFKIDNGPISGPIRSTVLETAEARGVPCVDLYDFTREHPEYFADGVHPNRLGNEKIADHLLHTGLLA